MIARRVVSRMAARGRTRFRLIDVVVLVAAALLVVQAPLSVVDAAWVANLESVPRLALAGLLVGYVIERTRAPALIGLPVSTLAGVEAVTWVYSQVAPGASMSERVAWLSARVGAWFDVVGGGGVSNDPLVFALAMGGLAWLLGTITAWVLFRDEAPWLAIVFNGVALLMNLSYAATSLVGYVGWFVFGSCTVLAAHQLATRTELWRRAQLHVSWRVVGNVLVGSAVAAGSLLSVAWALPTNVWSSDVASGWSRATSPWQGLEGDFDRWFAALNPNERNARGLSFGRTLAPRGSFDLGDTPVLEVRANGAVYLRATTADRYAGQAITSTETTAEPFDANQDLMPQEAIPRARGLLTVQVKVLASRTSVAFAPDAPLRFSMPTEVDTRGGDPNDLATVRLDAPIQQNQGYTVSTAASSATIQELRAAGGDYPAWVRERYLPLPRSLPRRVVQLAHDATSGATSAFDKAADLEGYLRENFTYTTHVPNVPTNRDWVDYFLFDSKQGYCDYFATAMVVMLRTQGVPARVASGFAPGEFDPNTGISTVRENHAHSWVEVYFPTYGWITFEPSAIRPIPPRVEEAPTDVAPPPPAVSEGADASRLTQEELDELLAIRDSSAPPPPKPFLATLPGVILVGLGALFLLALIASAILAIAWRRGFGSIAPYLRPYGQLVRLGTWSGALRARPSDTPLELASRMARQVPRAQPAIEELTSVYVEGTYGHRPPARDPWPTWLAVRRDVIRGLFARRLGGWFGTDESVALPPRSHPELLREWGRRRGPRS